MITKSKRQQPRFYTDPRTRCLFRVVGYEPAAKQFICESVYRMHGEWYDDMIRAGTATWIAGKVRIYVPVADVRSQERER